MSGSSGSPGYSPSEAPCEKLHISTPLGSPNLKTIAGIKPGDFLELSVQTSSIKVVVAKTSAGAIAGTVTTMAQRLIHCIQSGHQFVAEVQQVSGAQCRVTIHIK